MTACYKFFNRFWISELVAQLVARLRRKWKVSGSNPTLGKKNHFVILASRSLRLE